MEDWLAMVERQLRTKILESQQRTAETIHVLQEELAGVQRSQERLWEMVDTLEAMVGSITEEAVASPDAASSTTKIETENAAEPPPRTQPPIVGTGPSTSSSSVRDSVMSGILGQGAAGTSAIKWEPTGAAETKMGGNEGILLDAKRQ